MTSAPARPARSALSLPGYRFLWLTGGLWHVARWIAVFGTAYRINAQTSDPLLAQLVGTAFMTPMFVGGAVVGVITDRLDRARTVGRYLLFLIPLSGLMGLAVTVEAAPIGLSYLFVALVGVGNVIDMTSRRSIAFEAAGPALLTNAAALESIALHAGTMTGNLIGGALLQTLDSAAVYSGLAVVYLATFGLFRLAVRRLELPEPAEAGPGTNRDPGTGAAGPKPTGPNGERSLGQDLRTGLGLLRSHPVLRQFLFTTVIMNFFFYAFLPLVPHFADELGVGAFLAGLLSAAISMGTTVGAIVVARQQPERRGLLHVAGAFGAMTMLLVFANMWWYPAAFAALLFAGFLGSGFGTTQSALVVTLVDESLRGRALGTLSMAIGALPFGMFSLGLLARSTDPRLALNISVAVGLLLLVGFQVARPHIRRL